MKIFIKPAIVSRGKEGQGINTCRRAGCQGK
jgi:hypothetical protein